MRERLQQIPPVPRVILGTVLAIILLAVFKPPADTQDVSEHFDRVRYVLAEPAARAPQIQLFGRVQSPRAASLTAVVTANVAEIPVRAGNRVSQGDLMIQLPQDGGLGLGTGLVNILFFAVVIGLTAFLTISKTDVEIERMKD